MVLIIVLKRLTLSVHYRVNFARCTCVLLSPVRGLGVNSRLSGGCGVNAVQCFVFSLLH